MRFLGCLLMLLFVGFFVVASFGLSVIQVLMRLFGIDQRHPSTFRNGQPSQPEPEPQKRVFPKDEGEYVDFEEVRENDEKS